MRRGSIVAPLILIVIGVVFLVNNIRPELSLAEMLGRYWPFLLIAWGAIRLVEILIWAARGKALPASGISGGEWVLIFFLSLLGSGAFFVQRHWGSWPPTHIRLRSLEVFGEAFDYPVPEQTVAAPKSGRLLVENFRGNVRISGAETNEVKVSGRRTIRALQREEADEADRMSPVEVSQTGELLVIRTNQERSRSSRFVSTDLQIVVPKGTVIEGRGRHGDFDISDLLGSVTIVSDNSGVRIQNVEGDVRLDLRKSDIIRAQDVRGSVELKGRGHDLELNSIAGLVTVDGVYSGDVQFRNLAKPLRFESAQTEVQVERCPGELRISRGDIIAENVVGPIQISSRSKDIHLTDYTGPLQIAIDRGDIDLRPTRIPLPKMDVRTRSGEVDITLPEGAAFNLRATAHKGDIENEYGEPLRSESEGRTTVLHGKVGDGPEVVLTADRGTLTVRKSGVLTAPDPPTPVEPAVAPQAPATNR